MVCVFRILSFFRWLDDKLSGGLLQLHIKCPEAHFEGTIVFRVFLFFSTFEQSFSEFCQKTSGRLLKTVYHVYGGKFAGNCFSFLKCFCFLFSSRTRKKNFENLGEKCWLGSQTFFSNVHRNYLKEIFLRKVFEFFKKSSEFEQKFLWNFETWRKTSGNLAKLLVTCPYEVFEAVFWKKNVS